MKNFKDYEESIYKCSRCGLCQSVCPVFKVTLNECAVSRGKFNILNGIIKGDLTFNDNVKKYLDLCTGCNACKDFCPSGIDAREIFIAAKSEYYKHNKLPLLQKIINSYTMFKFLLYCASITGKFFRLTGFSTAIRFFENSILSCGYIGKRLVLINTLFERKLKKKSSRSEKKYCKKAIYFDGCFNKYINNDTKKAAKMLLEQCGIKVIEKNFECCGISYLHDGNTVEFKKITDKNLNELDCDYDYLLTDCASCNSVLKEYKNYNDSESAFQLSQKVTDVANLIENLNFEAIKNFSVAVHKPCHDSGDFVKIVKNIKGINFVEVQDYDKCCGFSGKFALQHQEISRKISKQKAQQYINANVDFIITTCPACLLGLNQGLAETNTHNKPVAINLYVFLAEFCKTI